MPCADAACHLDNTHTSYICSCFNTIIGCGTCTIHITILFCWRVVSFRLHNCLAHCFTVCSVCVHCQHFNMNVCITTGCAKLTMKTCMCAPHTYRLVATCTWTHHRKKIYRTQLFNMPVVMELIVVSRDWLLQSTNVSNESDPSPSHMLFHTPASPLLHTSTHPPS